MNEYEVKEENTSIDKAVYRHYKSLDQLDEVLLENSWITKYYDSYLPIGSIIVMPPHRRKEAEPTGNITLFDLIETS